MMQWRNPTYNVHGGIDVEINHPKFGWIPFTAAAGDAGAQFDVDAMLAEITAAGNIAAYVAPPTPDPVIPDLTFAQLLIGLVTEGWITEQEGEAWLAGTLPAAVTALIATLPQGQQFTAKARASRPSVVVRSDTLVAALGAAQGKTSDELDAFFTTYSQA